MSDPDLTPVTLAAMKRARWPEVSETEYRLWQHQPLTAAFLQFMEDQVASWRELAADLLEAGAFTPGARTEDNNPDVVRGKILAMRMLRQIELATIQGFYDAGSAAADMSDQA